MIGTKGSQPQAAPARVAGTWDFAAFAGALARARALPTLQMPRAIPQPDLESKTRLLGEEVPRSNEMQDSRCAAAIRGGCVNLITCGVSLVRLASPLLILLPPATVISDLVTIHSLASEGSLVWTTVLCVTLLAAWRACTLYMATRPVLSWRSLTALLVPGAAHLLVARARKAENRDAGTSAAVGYGEKDETTNGAPLVKLQELYDEAFSPSGGGARRLSAPASPASPASPQLSDTSAASSSAPSMPIGSTPRVVFTKQQPPASPPSSPPCSPPARLHGPSHAAHLPLPPPFIRASPRLDTDCATRALTTLSRPLPPLALPPSPTPSPPTDSLASCRSYEMPFSGDTSGNSFGRAPPATTFEEPAPAASASPQVVVPSGRPGLLSRRGIGLMSGRGSPLRRKARNSNEANGGGGGDRAGDGTASDERSPSPCDGEAAGGLLPKKRRNSNGRNPSPFQGRSNPSPFHGRSFFRRPISPQLVGAVADGDASLAGAAKRRQQRGGVGWQDSAHGGGSGPQASLAQLARSRLPPPPGELTLVLESDSHVLPSASTSAHGAFGAKLRAHLEAHAAMLARAGDGSGGEVTCSSFCRNTLLPLVSLLQWELRLTIYSVLLTPSHIWRAALVLLLDEAVPATGASASTMPPAGTPTSIAPSSFTNAAAASAASAAEAAATIASVTSATYEAAANCDQAAPRGRSRIFGGASKRSSDRKCSGSVGVSSSCDAGGGATKSFAALRTGFYGAAGGGVNGDGDGGAVFNDASGGDASAEASRVAAAAAARVEMIRGSKMLVLLVAATEVLPQLLIRLAHMFTAGCSACGNCCTAKGWSDYFEAAAAGEVIEGSASYSVLGFSFTSSDPIFYTPFTPSLFYTSLLFSMGALLGAASMLLADATLSTAPPPAEPPHDSSHLISQLTRLSKQVPAVDSRELLEAIFEARDAGALPTELAQACKALFASRVGHIRELKYGGFSAALSLAAGALPTELRDAGYTASELRAASSEAAGSNSSVTTLGAFDLRRAGYSLKELKVVGFSTQELRDAGFAASEMQGASVAQLRSMGYSAVEVAASVTNFADRVNEFRAAGFGALDLRSAGFSATAMCGAGYSVEDLKSAGFDASSMLSAGVNAASMPALFSAIELHAAGFPPKHLGTSSFRMAELREAGFTMSDLEDAGYSTAELRAVEHGEQRDLYSWDEIVMAIVEVKTAGCSAAKLREAGFACAELKAADVSLTELKAAGYDAAALLKEGGFALNKLRNVGCTASELRACGAQLPELHAAGFTAVQLRSAEYTLEEMARRATAAQLRQADYSATELKKVGFSLAQLKAAGFSARAMEKAGCTMVELVGAGFKFPDLMEAGYSEQTLTAAGVKREDDAHTRKSQAELKAYAGMTPEQMLEAGLTPLELKAEGVTATQLKALGKTPKWLSNGYSATQMREAGFSAVELKMVGFPPRTLKKAGYSEAEVKQAILAPRGGAPASASASVPPTAV